MKSIHYKNHIRGDYYKFTPSEGVSISDLDSVFDVINNQENSIISESEFNSNVSELDCVDVLNSGETHKIGILHYQNIEGI